LGETSNQTEAHRQHQHPTEKRITNIDAKPKRITNTNISLLGDNNVQAGRRQPRLLDILT
jgi:hypothetical protein